VDRRRLGGRRTRSATTIQTLGGIAAGFAFLALAAVTVASSGRPPVSQAPAGGATVGETAIGQQLFLQSCAACHGPGGQGTDNGPAIANAGQALTDFVLRTGRMPLADPKAPMERKPPAFDDAQIQALVAYVGSLGTGPAIPDVVTSGADLQAGRDLFTTNCAACHGPSGGGGAVGGGFVAPNLSQADPTTVGEAVVSGPGPMPRFSFTPEQLNDLAGYVESLPNAPSPGGVIVPAAGTVTEGAIAGLVLVLLLLVARWIGVRGEPGPDDGPVEAPTDAPGGPG
jgi:ubiquinol-cytochrome c reductase cytochrome c subunit